MQIKVFSHEAPIHCILPACPKTAIFEFSELEIFSPACVSSKEIVIEGSCNEVLENKHYYNGGKESEGSVLTVDATQKCWQEQQASSFDGNCCSES